MSALLETYRPRRDGVTIPAIAIWIALSILLHVALLLWVPRPRTPTDEKLEPPPMTVFLQSRPQPPQLSPPPPAPAPVTPPPKPRPQLAKPPRPVEKVRAPVIALSKPVPAETPAFVVPAPKPAETPPLAAKPITPPPAEHDLTAYIDARRRARGEAPADTPSPEVERANRNALANAALNRPSAPLNADSQKQSPSGGMFQMRRRGYDYAEFMFYGWNENFRRQGPQLIEVRKDNNSDIDIAVIRKIIEIIRVHESGDFKWYSKRTGKTITLSASTRDNSGLEDYMMQEFYEELHRYR